MHPNRPTAVCRGQDVRAAGATAGPVEALPLGSLAIRSTCDLLASRLQAPFRLAWSLVGLESEATGRS